VRGGKRNDEKLIGITLPQKAGKEVMKLKTSCFSSGIVTKLGTSFLTREGRTPSPNAEPLRK
jgi:hypothetical protein